MSSRQVAPIAVTLGAAVALVGTFITWVRSGQVSRSSYDVFDVVERLGFSPDGLVGVGLRAWPLVPLLLVLAAVANWYAVDHVVSHVATTGLTALAAIYPGSIAIAVLNAPDIVLFEIGPGPAVTIAGSVIVFAGALLSSIARARATRPSAPADDRS